MARSESIILTLSLLIAPLVFSARPTSSAPVNSRYTQQKRDPELNIYNNAFRPNDPLLLEVQWWSEVKNDKQPPSLLYRSKNPIYYTGAIGNKVVEKLTIPIAPDLLNNATRIFVAAVLCKHTPITARDGCNKERPRLGEAIRQNDHLQNVRASPLRYLLTETSQEVAFRAAPHWVWRPRLKLQVVYDEESYTELPELYRSFESNYLPPAILNNLELTEFEEIRGASSVTFEFSMLFIGKLEYYWLARVMQMFGLYEKIGVRGQELEDIKQTLLGNSWQVLYLTSVVAILHLVLDCLSFKNDISFWRRLKTMKGVSVRSLVIGAVCQAIVWLYLYDNDTSKLVLVPAAFSVLINLWKITKAVNIKVSFQRGVSVQTQDDYVKSHTQEFDKQAMRLVLALMLPAVACYSIYSLIYNKHKGWYSWGLESITTVVYAGGFLLMLPQVFVNYKLRSVAALPWRAFFYRAISTFIDDIFAFVIKMPTMHRLACFRDDVVFVIYLYQRWIYPVDHSRQADTGRDDDAGDAVPTTKGSLKKKKDQ